MRSRRRWRCAAASRPDTERRHAQALRLLDAYGVVTRDSVAAEGLAGGFSAVYPVLREMEERGRVRRGYFVEGLGGAQFALPAPRPAARRAADRRRRAQRTRGHAGGVRSGQPVRRGAGLAALVGRGPPAAARAAGAYVVLVDGEPALVLERGGRSLLTLPAADEPEVLTQAIEALAAGVVDGRRAALEVHRVDGLPVGGSPLAEALAAAGFRASYRGWVLRTTTPR